MWLRARSASGRPPRRRCCVRLFARAAAARRRVPRARLGDDRLQRSRRRRSRHRRIVPSHGDGGRGRCAVWSSSWPVQGLQQVHGVARLPRESGSRRAAAPEFFFGDARLPTPPRATEPEYGSGARSSRRTAEFRGRRNVPATFLLTRRRHHHHRAHRARPMAEDVEAGMAQRAAARRGGNASDIRKASALRAYLEAVREADEGRRADRVVRMVKDDLAPLRAPGIRRQVTCAENRRSPRDWAHARRTRIVDERTVRHHERRRRLDDRPDRRLRQMSAWSRSTRHTWYVRSSASAPACCSHTRWHAGWSCRAAVARPSAPPR